MGVKRPKTPKTPKTSTSLTEIPGGHPHRTPSSRAVFALLEPTRGWGLPAAGVDPRPVWWALAALGAQCGSCVEVVARWLAEEGDPWLLVRLVGPVAKDARLVAQRLGRGSQDPAVDAVALRGLAQQTYGSDVAEVVVQLASYGDREAAVRFVRALPVPRRMRMAQEILAGIGRRLPPSQLMSR